MESLFDLGSLMILRPMSKTVQEKRKAVLAECERLCPMAGNNYSLAFVGIVINIRRMYRAGAWFEITVVSFMPKQELSNATIGHDDPNDILIEDLYIALKLDKNELEQMAQSLVRFIEGVANQFQGKGLGNQAEKVLQEWRAAQ